MERVVNIPGFSLRNSCSEWKDHRNKSITGDCRQSKSAGNHTNNCVEDASLAEDGWKWKLLSWAHFLYEAVYWTKEADEKVCY